MQRRRLLIHLGALPAVSQATGAAAQQSAPPLEAATLAVPGPRNSVSLPLELARRIDLDRQAGLPLRLSFVGGGGVAIQELREGNAEFAVFGLICGAFFLWLKRIWPIAIAHAVWNLIFMVDPSMWN